MPVFYRGESHAVILASVWELPQWEWSWRTMQAVCEERTESGWLVIWTVDHGCLEAVRRVFASCNLGLVELEEQLCHARAQLVSSMSRRLLTDE